MSSSFVCGVCVVWCGVNQPDHDFILMAEFCEQRGPVPIMVWPHGSGGQRFDLNKFVVRILSSDHTRRLDPRGMSVGWQNPDDTQIYLTDESQGAHCYVSASILCNAQLALARLPLSSPSLPLPPHLPQL